MIQNPVKNNTNLASLFVFEDQENDDHLAYMEEIGTLIFQSALMQYLSTREEKDAKIFESFVVLNIDNTTFLESLCQEYPDFEIVLKEEILAFQTEITY
jgi:hypothetical protein